MKAPGVPHEFRSTFKGWALERTNFQHEISAKALAHTFGDAVEWAYLRSDAFAKRRRICSSGLISATKIKKFQRQGSSYSCNLKMLKF